MGFFRSDPQPVQLTPHVPAAALTTGSQPPRIASQLAMAMAVVSMAWPQPGEPHPIQPLQGRSQIAPLTLVYGQQPPVQGPLSAPQRVVARVAWPDDLRNQFNNQQPERRYVAPLTLVYGNQPPNVGPILPIELNAIVRSWDPPQQQPPPLVTSAAWNAPVVVIPIPVVGPTTPQDMAVVRSAWEPPAPYPPQLVKLVQTTGDQLPSDAKRVARHIAWRAWDVPFVPVPQPIGTAAWNVPAVVVTQVPFSRVPIVVVAQDWSAQRPAQIAPLTLTYGQNPPVNGAITPVELNAIVRGWDVVWGAQSQSPSAAWNVPAVVVPLVPFTSLPQSILRAWQSDALPTQPRPTAATIGIVLQFYNPVGSRTPQQILASWTPLANNPQARVWFTPSGAPVTLDFAIAQSNSTDTIVASSSATGTLMQNSGTVTIISSDSKTILLITGNSGVSSIDSDD